MKKIVISGYYGFGNTGDEAMLAMMIKNIREYCRDDIEITVISGDPEATQQRHNVKAIYKFDCATLWRTIVNCDLLISGGGSLLQNVTSKRSIYYYLAIIALAKVLRKPVMLYAQGIGPVLGRLAKFCLRLVLNRTQVITVRDTNSFEELKELAITKPHIEITADPVLAMDRQSLTAGRMELGRAEVPAMRKIIGVSVREWKGSEFFKRELAAALDELSVKHDASVVFFPMQRPIDTIVAQEISSYMQQTPYIMEKFLRIEELLSLCGCFQVLLAVRLHALIFGTVMNVPVVGLVYDPKVSSFLQSINNNNTLDITNLNSQQLVNMVDDIWNSSSVATEAVVERMKKLAIRNAKLVSDLLQKG